MVNAFGKRLRVDRGSSQATRSSSQVSNFYCAIAYARQSPASRNEAEAGIRFVTERFGNLAAMESHFHFVWDRIGQDGVVHSLRLPELRLRALACWN